MLKIRLRDLVVAACLLAVATFFFAWRSDPIGAQSDSTRPSSQTSFLLSGIDGETAEISFFLDPTGVQPQAAANCEAALTIDVFETPTFPPPSASDARTEPETWFDHLQAGDYTVFETPLFGDRGTVVDIRRIQVRGPCKLRSTTRQANSGGHTLRAFPGNIDLVNDG